MKNKKLMKYYRSLDKGDPISYEVINDIDRLRKSKDPNIKKRLKEISKGDPSKTQLLIKNLKIYSDNRSELSYNDKLSQLRKDVENHAANLNAYLENMKESMGKFKENMEKHVKESMENTEKHVKDQVDYAHGSLEKMLTEIDEKSSNIHGLVEDIKAVVGRVDKLESLVSTNAIESASTKRQINVLDNKIIEVEKEAKRSYDDSEIRDKITALTTTTYTKAGKEDLIESINRVNSSYIGGDKILMDFIVSLTKRVIKLELGGREVKKSFWGKIKSIFR